MPLRLAEWRKQRGWTQARLAKESGLSASAIAMYETGRRTPDTGAMARLAAALGVSIADLGDPRPDSDIASEARVQDEQRPKSTTTPTAPSQAVAAAAPSAPPHAMVTAPTDAASDAVPTASPASHAPTATTSGSNTTWSPATAMPLSRDEARIILFLRMHPEAMPFLLEYVSADSSRREQLQRTWRLIQQFQR
jgi:transcriptional regulator with XRE-family HTH domain